jgi:tRNA threonylcarbamoyladenosine biosynthesis protein TsaB
MTSRASFTADRLFEAGAGAGPILGIDTGLQVCATAIVCGGRVVAERAASSASHCAGLPGQVAELLEFAGLSLSDLRGFAVGLGPGSYTGLRVGLTYVKALAVVLAVPVAGVPSLDALANAAAALTSAPAESFVCPVVDARKGEIYTALYRVGADALEKLIDDLVTAPKHFQPPLKGDLLLVGDRMVRDAASALSTSDVRIGVLDAGGIASLGRFVAALGAARIARGESDLLATLEPLYVRPIEATFRPAKAGSPISGAEDLWRPERKRWFANLHPMTRN